MEKVLERIYFDNAATTALDKEVIREMVSVMENLPGNPSSIHHEGRLAKTAIEKSRKTVARLLGVAPGEIFFTSSGTEADNMAIKGAVKDLGVNHIITSRIEHHAVLHTVELFHDTHVKISFVKLLDNGHIDMDHLAELISKSESEKTLVTLMHANNEIGNLLDLEKTGALCKAQNIYFQTDTVQTIGHLPVKIKEAGIHFLSASAHKFHGPKGVGFIYIDENVKLNPFIHGGAQERNMRGGTENIYSIAGLARALDIAYTEMDSLTQKILGIKKYMLARLKTEFPNILFNGDPEGDSLYTVLNVAFPPSRAADMLLFNLDIEGISVSGGSACSSGSDQGSHVLNELKVPEGYNAVRFSFGKYNTIKEVDLVIEKLHQIFDGTQN